MVRAGFNVLATAVLLLAQVQCATACAGEICAELAKSEALPPCHRHGHHSQSQDQSNRQDPASCAHQNLSAPAISPQIVQVESPSLFVLGIPVSAVPLLPIETRADARHGSNFSPPGTGGLSCIVLRI
jgi:hypothetical protein